MAESTSQPPVNGSYFVPPAYPAEPYHNNPPPSNPPAANNVNPPAAHYQPQPPPQSTTPSSNAPPTTTSAATTNTTTAAAATSDSKDPVAIAKDEVGWFFVEQYYTTMSRAPEKLHLFYNRHSQFVNGNEADTVPVIVGQKVSQIPVWWSYMLCLSYVFLLRDMVSFIVIILRFAFIYLSWH
jgi:hypothetical protein